MARRPRLTTAQREEILRLLAEGKTQEQAAKLVGVSTRTVARIETAGRIAQEVTAGPDTYDSPSEARAGIEAALLLACRRMVRELDAVHRVTTRQLELAANEGTPAAASEVQRLTLAAAVIQDKLAAADDRLKAYEEARPKARRTRATFAPTVVQLQRGEKTSTKGVG